MLNKALYNALCAAVKARAFPGSKVLVINENELSSGWYDSVGEYHQQKAGEQYRVCCPSCGDRRYRLYISYRFGTQESTLSNRVNYPIHCFNEECQSKPFLLDIIRSHLQIYFPLNGAPILPAVTAQTEEGDSELTDIPFPAASVPIQDLSPEEPACQFLSARGFDPIALGENFGVQVCRHYDQNHLLDGRIMFPVIMEGRQVGYSARFVSPEGDGVTKFRRRCQRCGTITTDEVEAADEATVSPCTFCWGSRTRIPTYLTAKGMSKSRMLFNFDNASSWPFVVVCEGALDVIRLGSPKATELAGPGVAIFGHDVSEQQKQLLCKWRTGALILLLDGDVYSSKAGAVQSKALSFLSLAQSVFERGAVAVRLPDNRDPGDCEHDLLWNIIYRTAAAQHVALQ